MLLVVGALLGLPAGGLAQSPDTLRTRGAELGAAEQQARLELFALESKLGRAEAALADIQSRLTALERQRTSSRRQLAAARRTLAEAETAARRPGAHALCVGTTRCAGSLSRRRVARGCNRRSGQPPPSRRRHERRARRGSGRSSPGGRAPTKADVEAHGAAATGRSSSLPHGRARGRPGRPAELHLPASGRTGAQPAADRRSRGGSRSGAGSRDGGDGRGRDGAQHQLDRRTGGHHGAFAHA